MFKNVASKFIVFAFDTTTNLPKTGDAANITAYVSKDYGAVTVLGDTSATEMEATNAPGYYLFDAAQAETNADCLLVTAKSSTANVKVLGAPAVIYTYPTTGILAPTTAGRTLDVSAGGEAGLDWANIGSPTTAVNLSATNIDVDQVVASVSGAVGSVTGAVGSVAGDVGGDLLGDVTGFTAGALAEFITLDTGKTFNGDVVPGSVVYETVLPLNTAIQQLGTTLGDAIGGIGGVLTGLIVIRSAVGDTGNDTTHIDMGGITYADDAFNNQMIVVQDGLTGNYYSRWIEDYVGATSLATVATLPYTPAEGDTYWLLSIRRDVTATVAPADIRSAIGMASANLDTQLSGIQSDTDNIQTRLPTSLVSGRMDASVGAMALDVITNTALAASAVTEIQVGLATAADLATVDGNVDAIKAKTDQLTFTVANQVDSNIEYVNGTEVTGNGETGTEWGPA